PGTARVALHRPAADPMRDPLDVFCALRAGCFHDFRHPSSFVGGQPSASHPGGFDKTVFEPPGRAARPLAASSVAPISMDMDTPCVLPRERASHPGDEHRFIKPS